MIYFGFWVEVNFIVCVLFIEGKDFYRLFMEFFFRMKDFYFFYFELVN